MNITRIIPPLTGAVLGNVIVFSWAHTLQGYDVLIVILPGIILAEYFYPNFNYDIFNTPELFQWSILLICIVIYGLIGGLLGYALHKAFRHVVMMRKNS